MNNEGSFINKPLYNFYFNKIIVVDGKMKGKSIRQSMFKRKHYVRIGRNLKDFSCILSTKFDPTVSENTIFVSPNLMSKELSRFGFDMDGDSAIMMVENTVQQRVFQQSSDDHELAMSRYFNDDIEAFLMIAINLLSKENNHAST